MKNHVISYKMDGGVVSEEGLDTIKGVSRCDYLFVDQMDGLTAVLIELKGSDVNKAIEQISATLSLFSDVFRTMTHIYGRIVVSSSTPNLKASPGYVKLVKMLKQRYHGNLKIIERQLREKDVELYLV